MAVDDGARGEDVAGEDTGGGGGEAHAFVDAGAEEGEGVEEGGGGGDGGEGGEVGAGEGGEVGEVVGGVQEVVDG